MLDEIHSHALSTFPEECCGLMVGNSSRNYNDNGTKQITRIRRMDNAFDPSQRFHRYSIDPREFLKEEKSAEERGEEIIGVYHSHPNAPAKPSEFDRVHAWPELSYIIIEVVNGRILETKSWILREDKKGFIPQEIRVKLPEKEKSGLEC
jgi:proteasome lid subunit RPN8/RPN11